MEKRTNYLLAIGIDNYLGDWDKLNNAVSDTKAIVEVLTSKYFFELIQEPLYNEEATKENILLAFTNAIGMLTEDDNLIIYYGGHGFMHPLTMKGYWVPFGARKNVADYIPNSEIKDFIENILAKHIFLIADACFSGTFLSRTRGTALSERYVSLDSKVSRWMLASGGEETVSDGPVGQSSPFAKYVLKFLNENANKFISTLEIIRYVSLLTAHYARQQPKGAYIDNIGHNDGQMVLILNDDWVVTKIEQTNGDPQTECLRQEMRSVYRRKSTLSAGKEILLVDFFDDPDKLLVCECFRFDDNGKQKITYQGNKAKMPAKDDPDFSLTLQARFATWEGFHRFWDENKHLYGDRKPYVFPAVDEIDTVEDTEVAFYQQGIIQDMLDANQEPMRCLHCNTMITNNDSFMVEIDELGLNANVGNVHTGCRRPADRILGKSVFENINKSNLVSFDHKKWIELLEKGQVFLSGAKKIEINGRIPVLSWNRQHNFNNGNYCIKMILEDGSSHYVRIGKEIHRFTAGEIDQEVSDFKGSIEDAEKQGDPLGYTSKRKVFGPLSLLESSLLERERFLRILHHEKEQYSHQLGSIDHSIENDYTPLGILVYPDSGDFITLGDCIPLISDPTSFDNMHGNWNDAGYQIGNCALKIIESDKELDLYLNSFFADGIQPIIDPFFKTNQELEKGIYVKDIEELKQQAAVKDNTKHSYTFAQDGTWRAGDRVKVVFPNVKSDKHATGVLFTDEFTDENDEPCAIFRPIEDGIVREDLAYKMPTKLFVKD
ncbi:caspase family protein [Pedobacter sp. MC2016-14]|uniref:caspase family protein n=1 Tax=Pedobacter sp. MC2016-14 TaxID=2897327 RepID=UPI001E337B65|nr:caspase family protein [Pedobacter sp. MC2016-14]MCD0489961.1 caspase family protein [Pedobacter sp. MC2016-14]